MSGRFVRASKYRHVFGRSTRKEQCYDNLRISKNAWDTNIVKANPHYISVNWEAGGGGAFAVIPINEKGRLPEQMPLFRGHTSAVLDTDWSPFDDSFIASGSDDGKVFLWKVPKGFTLQTEAEEQEDVTPVAKLTGHSRKVGHVLFNPAAENILASASGDYKIKLWDVEAGSSRLELKHDDIVQSLSWSANGSLLVTTSRDKKLRIWDARQQKPAHVVPGHSGAKNSRAVWMGEHDRVATTGFSRMSDRQLGLWDIRDPKEPIGGFKILDSISGVCIPFWDDGSQCLYLAGKGDGNIRYYEYEHDKFEYLSEYKSADPQRGVAFLPKRGVNTHENEVMRAFKTVNDSYIEPVSFIVPRRAEVFQGDIYPPTTGTRPAMSAAEWFDGKEALPPKIDLESVYAGEKPAEVFLSSIPSKQKSSSPKASSPVKKEFEQPKQAPASNETQRGPPPKMEETKGSIAAMASKFVDKDAEESDDSEDDASSFEEVARPSERNALPSRMEEKTSSPLEKKEPQSPDRNAPLTARMEGKTASSLDYSSPQQTPLEKSDLNASTSAVTTSSTQSPLDARSASAKAFEPTHPLSTISSLPAQSKSATNSSSNERIQDYFHEIKSLLEQQSKTMASQNDKIGQLTTEIDTLKMKMGETRSERAKDERIKHLEAEIEKLRS
ncbi:MAG: Coronin-like protein crn1 [Candelina submexicana]|nr:MAG: Coronin-like protein crn1 [Candelina submexicana]